MALAKSGSFTDKQKGGHPRCKTNAGLTTFFEEPTYLDSLNALALGRFQYSSAKQHELSARDAGGLCAQASLGRLHNARSDVHQDEMPECGNNAAP